MTSNLNKSDFLKRLEENTEIGILQRITSPFQKYFSYEKPEKLLFGSYNENTFRITKNNYQRKMSFLIEGEMFSNDNETTEVNIKVKIRWSIVLWSLIMFIINLAILNFIIFYISRDSLTDLIIILTNTFIVLIYLIRILLVIRQKNKLISSFNMLFEIRKNNNHNGL